MATLRLQLKNGLSVNMPTSNMLEGEPHFLLDTGELKVATSPSSSLTVSPNIASLQSGSMSASDLLMFEDVSTVSGVRNKQITFSDFKDNLGIPTGSTDEKVSVANGETPNYLINVVTGSNGINITQSGSVLSFTANAFDIVSGLNGINITQSGSLTVFDLGTLNCGKFI